MQVTLWARMPSRVFLVSPFSFCSAGSHVSWHPKLPMHKSQCVFPSYVEVFPLKVVNQKPGQRMFWLKDYLVPCLKGYRSFVQVATNSMPSVRSGRKGRSVLVLDSAQLAGRSLYFCLNDSI